MEGIKNLIIATYYMFKEMCYRIRKKKKYFQKHTQKNYSNLI